MKNKKCKCKKFTGYTKGYICRSCKLPIYSEEQAREVDRLREEQEARVDKTTGRMKVILPPTLYKLAVKTYGEKYIMEHYVEDKPVPSV